MPPASNPNQQPVANQPGSMPVPAQVTPMPLSMPLQQPTAAAPITGTDKAKAEPSKHNPNSTQNALLIAEIRDSVVIMNDGSARAVVTCQSINFDLMSDRERDSSEFAYQQMLNSLYFPIQVLVRSQFVDINPYLERLVKISREQENMLLSVLMEDYVEFISQLAQQTNIMSKSFYVVVPYYPAGDVNSAVNTSKNFFANLFSPQTQQHVKIDEKTYAKITEELTNRINALLGGLIQMGIRAARLNTKELGELYYSSYNPDTAVRQPLGNFTDLSAPVISKGEGHAPQPQLDRQAQ
jgi:hypothetical protein